MPVIPESDVPCLLGLDTLADLKSILDCGARKLILPGSQGVQIHLGPDSRIIDLSVSPSGHLIMPMDHFSQLPQDPHSAPQVSLWVNSDHTRSEVVHEVLPGTAAPPQEHD